MENFDLCYFFVKILIHLGNVEYTYNDNKTNSKMAEIMFFNLKNVII